MQPLYLRHGQNKYEVFLDLYYPTFISRYIITSPYLFMQYIPIEYLYVCTSIYICLCVNNIHMYLYTYMMYVIIASLVVGFIRSSSSVAKATVIVTARHRLLKVTNE